MLVAALFTLVNVIEADRAKSDAAWLFVTAASFSLATAGGVLLVWAFLIRKAPRPLWVKGTEVLREVAVLCAVVFGAVVLYSANPDFHDRANEILMPALSFFGRKPLARGGRTSLKYANDSMVTLNFQKGTHLVVNAERTIPN